MLKPLLLLGWFRVKPFLKYVVVVMLIAPLVAASGHSTSAKQSEVANDTVVPEKSDSVTVLSDAVTQSDANAPDVINSLAGKSDSVPMEMATVEQAQVLQPDQVESLIAADNSSFRGGFATDPLAAVELAPQPEASGEQLDLAQRLKAGKIQILTQENSSSANKSLSDSLTAKIALLPGGSQPSTTEPPISVQPPEGQAAQDPLGSAYPIPWEWIQATQQAIGSKGGSGVRYYRSMPVVSPDGRYAMYSRVQLEVKPDLGKTRVSSVLFVEDRQTKNLRVVSSTSQNADALLKVKVANDANTEGTIGVLVPVSWSEKGDRFLARRFESVFNTSDMSDRAVIWDRQKNHTNTVAPNEAGIPKIIPSPQEEHEKMAILLGWSKTRPDHVMFRTGELGQENWPLVTVSSDGKTVAATDVDQPITFGQNGTNVWAGPQVAYR